MLHNHARISHHFVDRRVDPRHRRDLYGVDRHHSGPQSQRVRGDRLHGRHRAAPAGDRTWPRGCAAHQRGRISGTQVRGRRLFVVHRVRHLARQSGVRHRQQFVGKLCTCAHDQGVSAQHFEPETHHLFLAFLPQFVEPAAASPLAQLLVLSGVFMVMTFAVFVVYGFLAHSFRKAVIESPRLQAWLRRSFAAAFVGLGVNLAASEK